MALEKRGMRFKIPLELYKQELNSECAIKYDYTLSESIAFYTEMGGKEVVTVNVADLWEVYPKLQIGGWDDAYEAERRFASAIITAAQARRDKAAIDSLPKSVF